MVAYRCVCITHPFIHHRCVAAEKQQHHSLKIKNVAESIKRNLNAALPQVRVITLLLPDETELCAIQRESIMNEPRRDGESLKCGIKH